MLRCRSLLDGVEEEEEEEEEEAELPAADVEDDLEKDGEEMEKGSVLVFSCASSYSGASALRKTVTTSSIVCLTRRASFRTGRERLTYAIASVVNVVRDERVTRLTQHQDNPLPARNRYDLNDICCKHYYIQELIT